MLIHCASTHSSLAQLLSLTLSLNDSFYPHLCLLIINWIEERWRWFKEKYWRSWEKIILCVVQGFKGKDHTCWGLFIIAPNTMKHGLAAVAPYSILQSHGEEKTLKDFHQSYCMRFKNRLYRILRLLPVFTRWRNQCKNHNCVGMGWHAVVISARAEKTTSALISSKIDWSYHRSVYFWRDWHEHHAARETREESH